MRRRRRFTVPGLIAVAIVLIVMRLREAAPTVSGPDAGAPAATAQGSGAPASAAPPTVGERELVGPYPVVKVIDGDTIDVEIAGSLTPKERVRLLRINTPERHQPGYERATAAMKAMVEGRSVKLAFEEPGVGARDEYGRLLAYVMLDSTNVNLEMVRRGWTRFFTKYGEGRFAEQFRDAEEQARRGRAGLWTTDGWNMLPVESDGARSRR